MLDWDHRVARRLKLRELNILLAVVEAGSMAKAATRLAISQPAVSRAIADMEHTLGVRLLDRSPQGVEPTRYGRAVIRRGIAVFDELRQGVRDIDFLTDPTGGEVHLGSGIALAEGVVQAVIERLSLQIPRVVFHIDLGDTSAMYGMLRERRIELGFARMPGPTAETDIHVEILFEEPLIVAAGIESPWASRRSIRLAELVNEPWTWPPRGTLTDRLVKNAFAASGLEPPRACVHTHATGVRTGLAATGRFLAVLAPSLLKFSKQRGSIKILPVKLPGTQQQTTVVTLKNRTLSPLAERLIECARQIGNPFARRKL